MTVHPGKCIWLQSQDGISTLEAMECKLAHLIGTGPKLEKSRRRTPQQLHEAGLNVVTVNSPVTPYPSTKRQASQTASRNVSMQAFTWTNKFSYIEKTSRILKYGSIQL